MQRTYLRGTHDPAQRTKKEAMVTSRIGFCWVYKMW